MGEGWIDQPDQHLTTARDENPERLPPVVGMGGGNSAADRAAGRGNQVTSGARVLAPAGAQQTRGEWRVHACCAFALIVPRKGGSRRPRRRETLASGSR